MPSKKGVVILTLVFRQEARQWTGECRELGTATYGRTLKQARNELVELVELHLDTLENTSQRERFFSAHHIKLYSHQSAPGELASRVPVDSDIFVQAHRVVLGA